MLVFFFFIVVFIQSVLQTLQWQSLFSSIETNPAAVVWMSVLVSSWTGVLTFGLRFCFISGCVLQVSVRYVWLSSLGYRTPGDLGSLSFALFWRPLNTCHIITGSGRYVHVLTVLISYRKGFKVIYDKCPVQHADYGHDHLSSTHTPVKIMLII